MKSRVFVTVLSLCLLGAAAAAAKPVLCSGGDLAKAEAAREEARTALRSVLRYLKTPDPATKQRLIEWFGADSPEVRSSVERTLSLSLTWVDAFNFYCHYSNDGTRVRDEVDPATQEVIRVDRAGSLYAYVDPADFSKVYLGLAFYKAPGTGYDSRLGTVIHELTHYYLSGKTDDHEYGRESCRALAKQNPAKALKNADSYQYFVESWLT